MGDLIIRPTHEVSYEQWLPLWDGIHAHHNSPTIDESVSRNTFARQSEGCPKSGALRGLVAFLDEEPVGFAHYFLHQSSYQNEPVAQLEDLYVHEAARGKGAGMALISEVFLRIQQLGATEIRWVTSQDNTAALALYQKVGQQGDIIGFRAFF